MTFVLSILLFVALGLVYRFGTQAIASRRRGYIRSFEFPLGLFDKLRKHHPQLDLKQCQLVAQGLRQFFLAHLKSGRRFVAMPSQAADDLWHESGFGDASFAGGGEGFGDGSSFGGADGGGDGGSSCGGGGCGGGGD